MKIVIDTNVLVQIMQNEGAKDLIDPESGVVIDNAFGRAEALIEHIEAVRGTVVLPAPVVAEYLMGIDRSVYQTHLDILGGTKSIEVASFDQLAAVECAMLLSNQEMKMLDPDSKMAKLKYDRQILAIALANGAKQLWTHDQQLFKRANAAGLTAKSLASITPKPKQLNLPES